MQFTKFLKIFHTKQFQNVTRWQPILPLFVFSEWVANWRRLSDFDLACVLYFHLTPYTYTGSSVRRWSSTMFPRLPFQWDFNFSIKPLCLTKKYKPWKHQPNEVPEFGSIWVFDAIIFTLHIFGLVSRITVLPWSSMFSVFGPLHTGLYIFVLFFFKEFWQL